MPAPKPIVRVAPLGELNAYTVYEHKLDTLAQGSPTGLLLNFALAFLPLAVGIIVTVLSSSMSDLKVTLFFCVAIILLVAGLICLVLWWRMHRSARSLVHAIKKRMPPQGIPAAAAPAGPPAPPAIGPPAP